MSVYLYDKALISKLREITGDDRIHIIPPDQAISYLAQFDKDKVNLPAIVVSRGSTISITETKNQVSLLKGETVRINEDNTASKIKRFPIRITWNIDVFTVDRRTCDEIIRELVFYMLTYPRFEVEVPYGLDVPQNFDVFVDPDIADNSDLIEFPNTGETFRETITVYTENAQMFSTGKIYLTDMKVRVEDKTIN